MLLSFLWFRITLQLAPLEPPTGTILVGAWYDRVYAKDTPNSLNQRINNKLKIFHSDFDLNPAAENHISQIPEFILHLEESSSDAYAFVTIYPSTGFDISLDSMNAITDNIKSLLVKRKVFIRFAPEMNGSWFTYGQDPENFILAYRKFVSFIKSNIQDEFSERIAFVWSPNFSAGYPYLGDEFSPDPFTSDGKRRIKDLDTNGDGIFDGRDDAYIPYYPGDDVVDWVVGTNWPWISNVIPSHDKFSESLKVFYAYFSLSGCRHPLTGKVISTGGKPLVVPETGAAFHYGWANGNTDPIVSEVTRLQMKQTWWRSFLNEEMVQKFPMFKAVVFFEFVKPEGQTLRDFTNFGAITRSAGFHEEDNEVGKAFSQDLKAMPFVLFANSITNLNNSKIIDKGVATISSISTNAVPGTSNYSSKTSSEASSSIFICLDKLFLLLAVCVLEFIF